MASISATVTASEGGNNYFWETITESDTAVTELVAGGKYTVSVEGTFGSGTVEIKYGNASGNEGRSTVHSSYQTRSNPGHKYIISDKTGDRVQKTKMHGA